MCVCVCVCACVRVRERGGGGGIKLVTVPERLSYCVYSIGSLLDFIHLRFVCI